MRTAMQELIMFCGDSKELSQVKQYAEIQLEKEKQQIVDAAYAGKTMQCREGDRTPEQYYNETFKQ